MCECLHARVCITCLHVYQKRVSETLEMRLKMVMPWRWWEMNPGSLQEQHVLVVSEPSLQPCFIGGLKGAGLILL